MVFLTKILAALTAALSAFETVTAGVIHPAPRSAAPSLVGSAITFGTGTYPRANKVSDGSLLGVYTAFAGGNNVLTTVKSTDGGASWRQIGTITTEASSAHDTDNAYVLQLPGGKTLAAFRFHDRDPSNAKAYTYFRIQICQSSDLGATWTYLSTPDQGTGPVNGLWEPFLRNANDGSLQLFYSRENNASDQDTLMRVSHDGGATWTGPTTISGAELPAARDGMTGVATVSKSSLIAVFESEQNGLFTVNAISSADDGKTWGGRRRVYTPTGTSNNAGAPQVVNVGGRLVVSFMTDEDTSLHTWVTGADAKIITSTDGVNWGNKLTVFGVQSNWPGMITLDSSNLLVLADHNGAKSQHVSLS